MNRKLLLEQVVRRMGTLRDSGHGAAMGPWGCSHLGHREASVS